MSLPSSSHLSTMSSSSRIASSNCHSASAPADFSQSSISIMTCDSSNAGNSSSHMQQYTTARIKFLLKQQPSTYTVLKNEKKKSSICWEVFGFPAKKLENTKEYKKIDGFTSCEKCYETFSYASTTGTRNMLSHSCVKNLSNTKITTFTSSSSSSQRKLNGMMKIYKKVKLSEQELNTVKNLVSSWICHDMRPFKIIEDLGLKDLLQEFIVLGSKFGEFDVSCALRGAGTISNHIYDLVDDYRLKLKDILREPLDSGAICAIQKALEPYDISDLTKLSFISDRGTNLIKALQGYETLFCFPHRINNILKRAFFQQKIRQTSTNPSTTAQTTTPSGSNIVTNENCQSSSSSPSEEEEELCKPTKQIKTKKNKSLTRIENDPMKLELKDLHIKAQEIIETIKQCKKLNGLNKDIQASGGVALQQSTVIRWLSLINLLESLVKSYKQTKRILFSRRQQEKINKIDEYVLKQLICLLKPFKCVLQLVQEGLRILRIRLSELFDLMFELDLRHYTATLLHPRYRQLKGCSNAERDKVYSYIREEMKRIIYESKQQEDRVSPENKKRKVQVSILEQYEDDGDLNSSKIENNTSGSEDYDYNPMHTDELARYLALELDKSKLSSNPLEFWKEYQGMFPVLSKLARQIHCIPASSSAVERCFSSSGFVVNERRASLSPDQLDNIIFKNNQSLFIAAKNHPEMPVELQNLLEQVGDELILKIQLGCRPVKDFALKMINILADSKFTDKQLELGYDEIYHNYLLITIQNNHGYHVLQNILGNAPQTTTGRTVLILEKSMRIGLRYPIIPDEMIGLYDIPLIPNKPLTLNQLISTALNADKDFFIYDAGENIMCQTFVENILESNGLIPNIVDQATLDALKSIDSKTLVSTLGSRSNIVKEATDLAAKLHKLAFDHKTKLKKSKPKGFVLLRNANIIDSKSINVIENAILQLENND
ncbi:unnamed protein product [Rotaria sordida]|uniref:HAT C-terminal dimerisation domain-containing protein n=2 Tax=Rotaria sordida TaxID=392033 RepID=A0A815G5R6_9BILA|nr:unnamed protein product [Rotaria sordida]